MVFTVTDTTVIAASAARDVWLGQGGAPGATAGAASMDYVTLPSGLLMPAGGQIFFRDSNNIDATDKISVTLVAQP